MTKKDEMMWTVDETVEWIMHATGKNRRQARAALIEACRQGKISATGERVDTGEREPIPPDAWPAIH